jgi:Protein of unknown function (DUF3810)
LAWIALGVIAAVWHPSPQWVEQSFTNGYYPGWQHFWSAITWPLPFALGDLAIAAGIVAFVFIIVRVRPLWRLLVNAAALAGFFVLWFYAGWGFGYGRAPLESRSAFESQRVNSATIGELRARLVAHMNRLAPLAHVAERSDDFDVTALRDAWTPVVQRLGDDWTPNVRAAKFPAGGWFMNLSGTSGFTNPFTLETQLAPDLLWFERPFAQAHEWSHVAGYNREDEANYIAAVTCLRDNDVVAQYSGAIELFLYLPPLKNYPHSMFVPEVWQDFAAIRERNKHFVNLRLSRFSWRVYNSYLKSNRIASGVENYDEVTRLMAGIPLDAQGLPVAAASLSASGKSASTPRGNK